MEEEVKPVSEEETPTQAGSFEVDENTHATAPVEVELVEE